MRFRIPLQHVSSLTLMALFFYACDGGPTPHVNFEDEFADDKNVKTEETSYGTLATKDFLNVYQIDKEYHPENSKIDEVIKNSTTAAAANATSKNFSAILALDTRTAFDKSDIYLNKQDTEVDSTSGITCSFRITVDVRGLVISYTASEGLLSKFYSFDTYKKECEQDLKKTLYKLSAKSEFKFSYTHMQKELPVFATIPQVSVRVTPLAKTSLIRKTYILKPAETHEQYLSFLEKINKLKQEEDRKHPVAERSVDYRMPNFQEQMILLKDPSVTELSDLTLKLNGEKRPKEINQWRQGVFDPNSGVIGRTLFTILFYPFSLFVNHKEQYTFQSCNNIYVSTTLQGVAIKMESPSTKAAESACENEIQTFFNNKFARFNYLKASPILEKETQ